MNTLSMFLSPDYLLLKKAYEQLSQLGGDAAFLLALKQRLDELHPTAPELEPLTSRLFACEQCGGPLQVVRVARTCEKIAIDRRTGELVWASELLAAADGAPSFEVENAYVSCVQCETVSARVSYDMQQARLAITCCVCDDSYFLEEGEAVLEDVQGIPRPVCSPACRESLLCEP